MTEPYDLRAAISREDLTTATDEDACLYMVATTTEGDPQSWTVEAEDRAGRTETLTAERNRYFPGLDFSNTQPWAWSLPDDWVKITITTASGQRATF